MKTTPNEIRSVLTLAAVAIAALVLTSSANAGTIVVTSLTNNESDIVNTGGTLVSAANFGSQAGGNTTVDINGISHPVASAANNGPGADLVSGQVAINSTFDGNYRSGQAGAAGYTGDMLNLMGGIAGRGAPGPISLDISGLTIGTEYLFQGYWEANNFGQTASVTFEGTDTQGGITGVGGLGTLISYTFTAGDTSLDADLSKTGGSDNIWWLGYSLQETAAGPPPPPTVTVTDDFNTSHDYSGGDVTGTIWDGIRHNEGDIASVVANANTSSAGELSLASELSDWEHAENDGLLLYRNVDGDFVADVQATSATSGNWNGVGLMARLADPTADGDAGEDWVFLSYSTRFNNNRRRSVDNGVQSDAFAGAPPQQFLQMERSGDDFILRRKVNAGDAWTAIETVTRADLNGLPLQVGLWQATFTTGVQGGTLDNFSITVPGSAPIPEPATMCALGLAVAGLGGYVRKRRRA